jgi:hypothetical protein
MSCEASFADGVFAPVFHGATGDYCAILAGNPTVHQSVAVSGSAIIASGGNFRLSLDMSTSILRLASGVAVCQRRWAPGGQDALVITGWSETTSRRPVKAFYIAV